MENIAELMEGLSETMETPMEEQMLIKKVAKNVRNEYNREKAEQMFFDKMEVDRLERDLQEEYKYSE